MTQVLQIREQINKKSLFKNSQIQHLPIIYITVKYNNLKNLNLTNILNILKPKYQHIHIARENVDKLQNKN